MIVRTPERQFLVLQVLRSDEDEEIFVCRDAEDEKGGLCTLARFRNPVLNRYLLPMLTGQRLNTAFEDYLGVFSQDGDVYARFRYTDAPLLTQRLARGDFSFRERLEIGGNLLERMTLLNMPPALQFEVLRDQNITVDDALRPRFNYILESMSSCFNVDIGFICVRVSELLRALFEPELSARALPDLEDYLKRLEQTRFRNYLEIYAGYDQVRQKLLAQTASGPAEPRTWLFRLWNRLKGLTRFVRPILAGVVLVAAFCYLVYTLLLPTQIKGTPVLFDQVGTVAIQEESPAEPGES